MNPDKRPNDTDLGKFMTNAIKVMVIFIMGALAYLIVELNAIKILIGN